MKAPLKPFAALLVASMFAFAGCEKEYIHLYEPETPDPDPTENLYKGTSWTAHSENTYLYEEVIQMDITYDLSLDFLDSVSGELLHEFSLYVPAFPSASQNETYSEAFTYTFSGDTVTLTCTATDPETGEVIAYQYTLLHDKEANTLTLDFEDEEMAEIMGTSVMVFSPKETTSSPRGLSQQAETGRPCWGILPKAMI